MGHDRDEELLEAFWSLHAAQVRHDGLEARLRTGRCSRDLLTRSLRAAEGVVAARAALHRCLMRRGWTPPREVVVELASDEALLAQPSGALAG